MVDEILRKQFLDLSIKEFKEKNWDVTQQYMEVIDIVTDNNSPTIKRIEQEKNDCYAVYFPVKNEPFYYTHWFTLNPEPTLTGIYISAANTAYLHVSSSKIALEDILKIITFHPTKSWQRGNLRGGGISSLVTHKSSGVLFEPDINEAGNIENKLLKLLTVLRNYDKEIKQLKDAGCDVHIQAYLNSYIGNSSLSPLTLTIDIINLLSALELEIDFDLYTSGKSL
jgi:hypothetical protein